MSKKIGRNDPCPCGSGLKYKRCCLDRATATPGITQADRSMAFDALDRFSGEAVGQEDDIAYEEFWGEWWERADELDEIQTALGDAAFDMWFGFDRPLADGRLVVDRVLAELPTLAPGARRYLELVRNTAMRLYEVVAVRPGVSVGLRDVLDGDTVTVHERRASRQLGRADLLAARVIRCGVSGQPEMEGGVLQFPPLMRDSLVTQLSSHREDFRRERRISAGTAFYKEVAPFFHHAWLAARLEPPIPRLANTDGEELLVTRVHFGVADAGRLHEALDAKPELERDEGDTRWRWSGTNRSGEPVLLGHLVLAGETLTLETNSRDRGRRGRTLIEGLAGDAIRHRATSHEDLTRSLSEAMRSGAGRAPAGSRPAELPRDVLEDLTLDHYARHYQGWVDESVPALDGHTPREAAKDPSRRAKVEELVRGLEGLYERALKRNEPAYDPSWMWSELGLADDAPPMTPPPLAHERWAEAMPGLTEVSRGFASRFRARSGFEDAASVVPRPELAVDLDVRRWLARQTPTSVPAGQTEVAPDGQAEAKIHHAINHELHRRKTFWVEESLAYMLAHTDLDVVGEAVRVPFPSFALVFTDRYVLSLLERLLAADRSCPLAGFMLAVLTVYVTETREGNERVLRLAMAPDAFGADPPPLLEHELRLSADRPVEALMSEPSATLEGGDTLPGRRPLPGLLHVVLNAIVYATSAGAQTEVRPPPRDAARSSDAPPVFSSEEVFFLPGKIEISRLRQMQSLARFKEGRTVLHRFMVRGHWRRPAKTWKDRRMRWIEPHWRGPDIAAVIERTYKLAP